MISEKGLKDAKIDDLASLRLQLTSLEREYNSIRHELFNKMKSYYNQSIASTFIKEDDIRRLINQCEEIKHLYLSTKSKLMNNRPKNKNWSFNNSKLFKKTKKEYSNDNN